MTSFIKEVIVDIQNKGIDISQLTFILPSKRAGAFLKQELIQTIKETMFSPAIISIETFVENLSQLHAVSNITLTFEFYNTYLQLTKKEAQEPFESFSKWAQIVLQDFNEIDRYLIPQDQIFNYLSAIKEIEHNHWSLDENKSDFITDYLAFWNKLSDYYKHFTHALLSKKLGYQGLIYREAVENLEVFIENKSDSKFVFLGFNALNAAEEIIIQELLQNDMASIYWDVDEVFMNTENHNASLFIKKYTKEWHYYQHNPFHWITKNYATSKHISVLGVSKQVGQAKLIGSIINDLTKKDIPLNKTAIVLGDENLLNPVLNSLPTSANSINVTMGFPLKSIPLASLFELLFYIHQSPSKQFYYKDVINLLSHPNLRALFELKGTDYASRAIETISSQNLFYLDHHVFLKLLNPVIDITNLIFKSWENDASLALNNCSKLIQFIKSSLSENKKENLLSLEYLYRFNEIFNDIYQLNSKYNHIKNITTLHTVFKELLDTEKLDFQGEPLQGLQIMGMLESRALDFETVIISSVNEGILPSGKTNNSFIPFDVKLENNMPTYKEKDAVYTYHFFRLLQRAKHVYIIYNSEPNALTGGEKSRFITQLELEGIHTINTHIVATNAGFIEKPIKMIKKTAGVIDQLKAVAEKGFSPSALTNYIRNPIDFYYQKILKVKKYDNVEETIAANTLGTVVHNTLEDLYKPFIAQFLKEADLKKMKLQIDDTVMHHFKSEYKLGDITTGKNLIIYEIAKRYVSNFLDLEIHDLKQGNTIKLLAIESENKIEIEIPELDFPVYLTGKVDRVDQYNGITRVIDYKTGKVDQNKVEISNWDDITSDYDKYSKSFQVLTYTLMMQNDLTLPVEAGIMSFKNLSSGFLKFSKKDGPTARSKNSQITQETLDNFQVALKNLIVEICNPDIDFIEKDVS